MISNYIRTTLRKFARTRLHTLVNLSGLTLGLLCALIIFQKVRYETSFDRYHEDSDLIFRVVRSVQEDGETYHGAGLPYPFVNAFRNDFPYVPEVTLIDRNFAPPLIAVPQEDGRVDRFKEEMGVAFVEPDYLEIFSYGWIAGNPDLALTGPRSVVLSRSLADKYFGTVDVLGRTLSFSNALELTVTGVVEDPPPNTEVPFHMLISRNVGEDSDFKRESDSWGSISSAVQTYIRIGTRSDRARLEAELPGFVARYHEPEDAAVLSFHLQPLTEIHVDPRYGTFGDGDAISPDALLTLQWVGIFLLLTACINFVNLNVVLVFTRAREIAVRKVMGGSARQVIAYFMTETAFSVGLALILAFLLANPVLRMARGAVGEGFSVNPFGDPVLVLAAIIAAAVLTLVAGFYPALLQSRIEPALAIRGDSADQPRSFLSVRRGLVAFQFAISQVFIICTLVAMQQMKYIASAPLGYDTEAVVEFPVPTRNDGKIGLLQERLAGDGSILGATWSNSGATSGNSWSSSLGLRKDGELIEADAQVKLVGHDYLDVYGMELIAGRNFVESDSASGIIVNEAFISEMGYATPEDILGTLVDVWAWENQQVGS